MKTVKFSVQGQQLSPSETISGLVSGTKNYIQFAFDFDNDWKGHAAIAVFYGVDNRKDVAVKVANGCCMIPDQAAARESFRFSVVGIGKDSKITTNKLLIKMEV